MLADKWVYWMILSWNKMNDFKQKEIYEIEKKSG